MSEQRCRGDKMQEYLLPKKIVESKCVTAVKNLLENKPMQIGTAEWQVSSFEEDSYIILDFGKEMNGGIRILTSDSNNARVRIRFGESVTECCAELGGEQNATNSHALRDFAVELPFWSDMTFGNTGFRYVRLDFMGYASIKSVLAVNHILRRRSLYKYSGDDKLTKSIFDVAKRTVDLCAAGGYLWDGVKRDRVIWIGDMHPEMIALTTLYGRLSVIEKSLDFVKMQTPLPNWMNGFPMYSMWWMIIVADYFERTNAKDFVEKQLGYMTKLIEQMLQCVSEEGELNYPSYFVDWPTSGKPDEFHGVRAINIIAAQKAISLFNAFGKETCEAEELLQRLLKVEMNVTSSKQVLGLKYFAVGLTELDKEKLVKDGAHGMSTFMSYYILKAVASFDKQKAIAMMKEYYGGMLSKGATTFWEDFDLKWMDNSGTIDEFPQEGVKDIHGDFGAYCYKGFRHSLCHGWSAGVVAFISEEAE